MSTLQPLSNFVLLKRDEQLQKTASGLFLPNAAQEKSTTAVVVAVGPGMWSNGCFVETTVKVGDRVLVDKIGGFDLEFNEEKLVVVREQEIIALIR